MNSLYKEMAQPSIIDQFNQFRQTFRGDPKQELQRLINSGQISQQELNAAQQKAQELSQILRW